jgi:hypothetical protein
VTPVTRLMTKIKELSILLVNNGGYGADEFSVSGAWTAAAHPGVRFPVIRPASSMVLTAVQERRDAGVRDLIADDPAVAFRADGLAGAQVAQGLGDGAVVDPCRGGEV